MRLVNVLLYIIIYYLYSFPCNDYHMQNCHLIICVRKYNWFSVELSQVDTFFGVISSNISYSTTSINYNKTITYKRYQWVAIVSSTGTHTMLVFWFLLFYFYLLKIKWTFLILSSILSNILQDDSQIWR